MTYFSVESGTKNPACVGMQQSHGESDLRSSGDNQDRGEDHSENDPRDS